MTTRVYTGILWIWFIFQLHTYYIQSITFI